MDNNPLSKLNLKWWHTVLLTSSFLVFILSLTVEMKVADNETIAFLSSGIFFIALGEFANQTFQHGFIPGYQVSKDIRKQTYAGTILFIVGLYLLYKGIF